MKCACAGESAREHVVVVVVMVLVVAVVWFTQGAQAAQSHPMPRTVCVGRAMSSVVRCGGLGPPPPATFLFVSPVAIGIGY